MSEEIFLLTSLLIKGTHRFYNFTIIFPQHFEDINPLSYEIHWFDLGVYCLSDIILL